ncbi:NAD(P)/FAD-dependent oxidoreductase [Hyphobacterium sp. HN65]|uniref:NAD(P)/FAD-dependent oxidoreductase n=1 Tax=Hyphobacterium lacteum TaxID=3116575 RepID=A0ABU7LSA0_9PROT|nr:NAD(P)/FAD-dependent oxidoreductase [Hyphobacterium sp. HN65]MEE2526796.1 NAD(P)/FAD-dependent oxidoreductase [Hyphobacterium sp. HN65]
MTTGHENEHFDALVVGAGAAGLFYGARAGEKGLRVLVIDHAKKPAEKVRISGGGRCNFTNIHTTPANFLSDNPHFAKSALARYTPQDFIGRLERHNIGWHEKTLGQLFCDERSGAIIDMLLAELRAAGGTLRLETTVSNIALTDSGFQIMTSSGPVSATRLVIASGGLSIPKMGATGFAYDVARQFGHAVIEPRPALVPFVFEGRAKTDFAEISGVACPVRASNERAAFDEAMLFTHRGLSGPAILQISSYWAERETITIDLLGGLDAPAALKAFKAGHPKKSLVSALETLLPSRLVAMLAARGDIPDCPRLADLSHAAIDALVDGLSHWTLKPAGTEGWRTAEVTAGGVDTAGLSSQTMQSKSVPGLFFIGECVDVTGWLGGYNFQWAWASAHAAAQA